MQTINPGAYLTGFNDRIAETTYRWQDDSVNFSQERDIREHFAQIMAGQLDPQDMIDKIVEIIGKDGLYRNVWPPSFEDLIKSVQADAWSRQVSSTE